MRHKLVIASQTNITAYLEGTTCRYKNVEPFDILVLVLSLNNTKYRSVIICKNSGRSRQTAKQRHGRIIANIIEKLDGKEFSEYLSIFERHCNNPAVMRVLSAGQV